ncbi:13401_t:CDS:2 [Funneliformis caledonium]|uniref:13401_t:CDS:1 n=1 Tax=Funneliformis caledonium TaxID=1117310 RepID=A0A9N8VEL0_9GLOM|nr:13401_t:CDS:2 [Funneliformis caledonium]
MIEIKAKFKLKYCIIKRPVVDLVVLSDDLIMIDLKKVASGG